MNSEGNWTWADCQRPFTITYWGNGEPNNGADDEDCLVSSGGSWNDLSCSTELQCVCEKNVCMKTWATAGYIYFKVFPRLC